MIPETQLLAIAEMFSDSNRDRLVTYYNGFRIQIEEWEGVFDYEILQESTRAGDWHTMHYEDGFESIEQANKEAIYYIDNWEPNEDYYAQ